MGNARVIDEDGGRRSIELAKGISYRLLISDVTVDKLSAESVCDILPRSLIAVQYGKVGAFLCKAATDGGPDS
jgi:hypothetical protein